MGDNIYVIVTNPDIQYTTTVGTGYPDDRGDLTTYTIDVPVPSTTDDGDPIGTPDSTSMTRRVATFTRTLLYTGSTPIYGPQTSVDMTEQGLFGGPVTVFVQTLPSYAVSMTPAPSQSLSATSTSSPISTPSSTTTSTSSGNGTASAASTIAKATSDDGVSTGTLAGAIIGSTVGASLVTGLIMFLFFGRRKKRSRTSAFLMEKPAAVHPWEAFLPQSSDDQTIRRAVESLYSQIDMHVENYYAPKSGIQGTSDEMLSKVDSGKMPASVISMLAASSRPLPIIKHCIAWTILSRLSPSASGESSLLPVQFAQLPPILQQSSLPKGSARETQDIPRAYSYWRVLTAHLLYPRSARKPGSATGTSDNAQNCSNLLSAAFAPWVQTESGTAVREHLATIMKTATEVGLLLMSQPSTFVFDWETGSEIGRSTIVVLPALEKSIDERGSDLFQNQVIVNPRGENIS